ncbi:hypothetical protein Patl1_25759 [Pistacia atlantica]|uniref:Uncharacterized protein n=1 Tax=Pistacia atlantica TaxID=434234 RepID=A0ACC1B0M7_9ROSI|nr:hypothetical protein Patl1_25759 [Pistacia atlantica]
MLTEKKNPLPEIPTIQEQEAEEEEEELLLLQENATMDSSSFFKDEPTATTTTSFSNLHLTNHHSCSSCGCNGNSASATPSSSSATLKRSSSESNTLQPSSKKPNINPTSLFGFSKIPLPTTSANTSPSVSAPASNTSPSHPFLRRCVYDLGDPLPTQVAAETPQSPQSQNANMVCPGTPLSAAKFPPIPSTLRRSVSDPNPSPAPTLSSSCDGVGEYDVPNAEWARKFSNCMKEMARKWDELLGFEEDKGREENHNRSYSNNVENNNASMDNCGEDFVEAVTVEKAGECLIIHFKCPCGRGYQILLSGKNCYYKLM